jgi:hypothetical protein
MFTKTECVGKKLCPDSLKKLNVKGLARKVVLVPYLKRKGYHIGLLSDSETFIWTDCEANEKPFDCIEETLKITKLPSKNITHIALIGLDKIEEMLIFVKLDEQFKCLNFIKVSPESDFKYKWYILYTLDPKYTVQKRNL